jgi:hypothetical protein
MISLGLALRSGLSSQRMRGAAAGGVCLWPCTVMGWTRVRVSGFHVSTRALCMSESALRLSSLPGVRGCSPSGGGAPIIPFGNLDIPKVPHCTPSFVQRLPTTPHKIPPKMHQLLTLMINPFPRHQLHANRHTGSYNVRWDAI